MTTAKLELVLEAHRRFEAADMDGVAELYADDALMTPPARWPEPGPVEGKLAVIDQFVRLVSDWEAHRFEDIELIGQTDDWVVIRFTWQTRGMNSGIETPFRMAAAYRVRDGRIAQAHFRWDEQDALAWAGLRMP